MGLRKMAAPARLAPFTNRKPKSQPLIRRLFSMPHVDALAAEVESEIARHWPGTVPSRADVVPIEAKHRISLASRGIKIARDLLQAGADDLTSTLPFKAPLQRVSELAKAFGLPQREVMRTLENSGRSMLKREVARSLEDEKLTDEEHCAIQAAARDLGLTEADVTAAFVEQIGALYRRRVHDALADGQLSPDEEEYLARLADNLHLNVQREPKLMEQMEKARALWAVMNGPLPDVRPAIYLQRGEQCVFTSDARAIEQRVRTKSYTYGGPSVSIPIIKGVRYRVGYGRIQRETEEYRHSFGDGSFYLTNKRLLWNGPNKNVAINLRKIIDFDPYTDGVRIVKDTGKPLLFAFSSDRQNFAPLMCRVLSEAR